MRVSVRVLETVVDVFIIICAVDVVVVVAAAAVDPRDSRKSRHKTLFKLRVRIPNVFVRCASYKNPFEANFGA